MDEQRDGNRPPARPEEPATDLGMQKRPSLESPPHEESEGNPFGLFPLIILLVLVGAGLFIALRLRDSARTQDCVWSGRKNCAPVDPSNP